MAMVTLSEYIDGIKKMDDVMGLAKHLKKMDVDNQTVENLVARGQVKLMEVDQMEYHKYIEWVGCHQNVDEFYGCTIYKINCNHGGTIEITDWIDVEGTKSIGSITISNGWGMVGSQAINSIRDINKQIMDADHISWINDQERKFLIQSLEKLKRGMG